MLQPQMDNQTNKLYQECELAGLKAVVKLLEHQPLGSKDSGTKGNTRVNGDADVTSMLFHRYFNIFMMALGSDILSVR